MHRNAREGTAMQVAKREIVDLFIARDDLARAEQADTSLPDPVDLHADADALRALGLDAGLLATQIGNLES